MREPQLTATPQPPPGWYHPAQNASIIHKHYAFDNWREALIFVELVLYLGEQAGLRPGIVICGSQVAVQVAAEELEFARSLDPPIGAGNY